MKNKDRIFYNWLYNGCGIFTVDLKQLILSGKKYKLLILLHYQFQKNIIPNALKYKGL